MGKRSVMKVKRKKGEKRKKRRKRERRKVRKVRKGWKGKKQSSYEEEGAKKGWLVKWKVRALEGALWKGLCGRCSVLLLLYYYPSCPYAILPDPLVLLSYVLGLSSLSCPLVLLFSADQDDDAPLSAKCW
jgi:hypothetical protein